MWSSLPIIYRLVILKHLKNRSVLLENESNQQSNENMSFKIGLAVKGQDLRTTTAKDCSANVMMSRTLRFLIMFFDSFMNLTSMHRWNHLKNDIYCYSESPKLPFNIPVYIYKKRSGYSPPAPNEVYYVGFRAFMSPPI